MARGKFRMRRIENPVHRRVTFCKRRMGLLNEANELSVLCDADVGVMVFSPRGRIYELATNGSMQDLVERYNGSNMEARGESSKNNPQVIQQGIAHMNLHELHALENNLEIWADNIRSTKMQIMSREIEVLKNKEAMLKATNDKLQEMSGILDTGSNTMIPQFPF
ncbi:unnamed protein product [Alopecurus aequalis]